VTGQQPLTEVEELFVACVNSAEMARREGDDGKAQELFSHAANILREVGVAGVRPLLESAFLSQFGLFLTSHGMATEAVRMQRLALAIDQQHGSESDVAFTCHNLASAYRELGEIDLALPLFQRAVAGFLTAGVPAEASNSLGEMATMLIEAGRADEAEQYL